MADKYIRRDQTTGLTTETEGQVTGGTVGQAGKIAALDADGRFNPTLMPVGVMADTLSVTAFEALSAGDFVYIRPDGQAAKASAGVSGVPADGFVLASSASAASALVYFEGRNTALTGLTAGSRYYLSDTTAGGVTSTPVSGTGKKHQYLGKAVSTTSISFEGDDYIVLA